MEISMTNLPSIQLATQTTTTAIGAGGPSAPGSVGVMPAAPGQQLPGQSASAEAVANAARTVERFVKQAAQNLEFSIDRDTDKTVVKLIDSETKQVIRQIPSTEMIAIAKALDKFQGLFVERKA